MTNVDALFPTTRLGFHYTSSVLVFEDMGIAKMLYPGVFFNVISVHIYPVNSAR